MIRMDIHRCGHALIFLLLSFCGLSALGQDTPDTIGQRPYSLIKINFEKRKLEPTYLPFDVPFVFVAPAPDSVGINSIVIKCYRKGKGGRGALVFTTKMEKSLFTSDSLYANVNTPLKAIQSYSFDFIVSRGITPKEDTALTNLLRPLINSSLRKLYNDHPNDLHTQLTTDAGTRNMRDAIRTVVKKFYTDRHLDINAQIDMAIDNADVQLFLKRDLLLPLTIKRGALNNIENKITRSIDPFYVRDPVDSNNIVNWRLFQLLYDSSSKFRMIDSSTRVFIKHALRREDTLHNLIHCKPLRLNNYPDLWSSQDTYPANDIAGFVAVSDSFSKACAKLTNILLDIREDTSSVRFFRRLGILKDIEDEIKDFREFLARIQLLNRYMHDYYNAAVALDSLLATNAYHLNTVFKIPITDETMGLTSADFVTRGEWYIVADIGFCYINASPNGTVRPYVGVNFNIFPINRQVNYSIFSRSSSGRSIAGNILRSLSISVGMTVFNGFTDKDRYIDLFGTTGSALTGLSLRISDGIRITGGACWVYKKDKNPLSDGKSLAGLGYGALSIDLDLKKWLRGFGSVFFK